MAKKTLFALIALMLGSVASAQHDQYGKWQLSDQGMVFLSSTTSEDNVLSIEYGQGKYFFFFHLYGALDPKVVGHDGKTPIVEIEMAFDNTDYGYFTFREGADFSTHFYYEYVTYDRFRGTVVKDATSIVKQMTNKQTLTIRYKLKNGSTITQTFKLEGLDAILEVLSE